MAGRVLKIGKHLIGDNQPCFITYEAGPTHNGVDTAIALVREAAKAKADAIKFQIFDVERLVQDKKQLFSYSILVDRTSGKTKEVEEPLYDILKRRCLSQAEWIQVKDEADKHGLSFFATIGFEEDLELIKELGVSSVKIASADVNHYPLLRLAAQSGLNVQLDTGNAEIEEIRDAVSILEEAGCYSIILHQCPSGYPARLPSICLNMISTLRSEFPHYPIAYSDHTPDADMDIAAVALGANLVEKTITLDRCTPSVEHVFSLEPGEMWSFRRRIRDVETALGDHYRRLTDSQKVSRMKLRRGVYLKQDVLKGSSISEAEIEFRRPCRGLEVHQFDILARNGAQFAKDLVAGHDLVESDIQKDE